MSIDPTILAWIIIVIIKPSPALSPYISHFMHVKLEKTMQTYLSATSTPTLVLFRRGGVRLMEEGVLAEKVPLAYIDGPFLSPRRSKAEDESEVISVHFKPAALGFFVHENAPVFLNQSVALSDMTDTDWCGLHDQVVEAPGVQEAIRFIEARFLRLFLNRNLKLKRPLKPLLLSTGAILSSTKVLADSYDISVRQFERRFKLSYGMSAREWRRLARASQALIALLGSSQSNNMAMIAQQAHYFDHAHFCRDFKTLTGLSPALFRERVIADPAFWPFRAFLLVSGK